MRRVCTFLALSLVVTSTAAAATRDVVSYAQVRQAVAAMHAAASARAIAAGPYWIDCDPFRDFTGAVYGDRAEAGVESYAYTADRVIGLETDLPRVGYPRDVWGAWLARYERDAIAPHASSPTVLPSGAGIGSLGLDGLGGRRVARRSAFDGLATLLASYRRTHPAARPVRVGACVEGDGERPIGFVTRPAATHVFIIPSFFYELCRVRKVDPEDTSRCEHWREVLTTVVPITGRYHYIAKWGDGTIARGVLDEEDPATGTITLRKP